MAGIIERFMKKVSLPELQRKLPLIEILGNSRVLIENHRYVQRYSTECICIRVENGCIRIEGVALRLSRMCQAQLLITGSVRSIMLEGACTGKRR